MTEEHRDPHHSRLVRAAAVVGDLDSPFYTEERDRDVWNEASAIGFQAFLWGVPLVASASMWIAGAPALLPVGLLLALWIGSTAAVLSYAQRFGVDPNARTSVIAGRHALFITVLGLLGTGVVRAALDLEVAGTSSAASLLRGMGQGAAVAAAIGTLVLIVLIVRDLRRSPTP